jgi:hypothetical protein
MIRLISIALLVAGPMFSQQGPPAPPIPPAPPPPTLLTPPPPPPVPPEVRIQVPVSIVDENEASVAGATAIFTRVSGYKTASIPGKPLQGIEVVSAKSGANGVAVLANGLVGARYHACVSAPLFLASCLWDGATTFTPPAQPSSTATPLSIGIKHGAVVTVAVHDPQGKFPASTFAPGVPRGFNVGVRTPSGAFVAADFISRSGTDLQFRLLVPPGLNLTLSFLCRQFDAVTDSGGTLDATGKGQQFTLPNAATQAQFRLTLVTPTRPVSSILGH